MTKARVATRYGKDASYLRLPAGIPTGAGTMAGRILNARPDRVRRHAGHDATPVDERVDMMAI